MHILIVKLSSIGDVVHTLPAVARLRQSAPDARISWVVERRASEILKGSPVIDDLIELDTRTWRKHPLSHDSLAEIGERLRALRGNRSANPVDLAIDFQGLIKSSVVAYASGAPSRFGFESHDLREKASRLFLTNQVRTAHRARVIDKNISLALGALSLDGAFSSNGGPYEFPISVSPEDEKYAEKTIGGGDGEPGQPAGRAHAGFALINPGGGWPTKLWSADHYGSVADWLFDRYGLESLITYGPGEEALARSVVENSRSGAARVIASTLKQFVALARRARLFIGGDTGPLHLAAASGTPIVGLYGPTSSERNGPFDPRDPTVGRDLWCREDCHRRSCWHWECMEIPVSEVQRAIERRMGESAEC